MRGGKWWQGLTGCGDRVSHFYWFARTNDVFCFHPETIFLVGTEEIDRAGGF